MPWSRSLLVRLLAPYAVTLVAVAAGLYFYGDAIVERLYLTILSRDAGQQARLVGKLIPWDSSNLDGACQALGQELGVRLSVIATDGTVLGDSDVASKSLDNHRDRPEVRAALRDGDGEAVRHSLSVDQTLFYRAWRQVHGDERRIIRLAVRLESIEAARRRIGWAIVIGVLIAALAAFVPTLVVSRRLSDRITRLASFSDAVARGDAPGTLPAHGKDVISALEANLSAMAQSLRSQLALAREEAGKLEAVLAGMVEGVIVFDRGGTIRLANDRAKQLLAVNSLVDQPLINVSRDPDLHELVRAVTRGDGPLPIVREIVLDRETREYLSVTATPIAARRDAISLFILVFHDITQMKMVETMRRDFVANVSHELRTPLTSVVGYTETLQAGAMNNPELATKFLAVIARHCDRLSRLVDDLLTLSDLELGRAALQRATLAIDEVINVAIDVLRDKAEKAKVSLQADLPAALPPLYGDADRIEQVLLNLIDNAIKYTPAGGSIRITAALIAGPLTATGLPTTKPGGGEPKSGASEPKSGGSEPWIEIAVGDTGVGVPKQDLPRLTERFYRVDKARSRELGGTGLGLAIVKHIVQAHGGRLRIESIHGEGTTVYVYFPLNIPGERPASWK